MKFLARFRGLPQVARQEFWLNLRSVRFLIMTALLALVVVGGGYGVSGITSTGGPTPLPVGPDLAIFFMTTFVSLIVPIFSIVIAFDAVSKERVQGTLDLLLSRPVTKVGVVLGKFLGAFAAVAFPVLLVLPAGLGIVSARTGQSPSGAFAATFLGMTLLLIAYYVLIQMIFSSLARTGGTAVLYGVLVWLLLNVLYGIVTLVLGLVFFSDPASRADFDRAATLGNPGGIASNLIFSQAPAGIRRFLQNAALDPTVAAVAAIVWFVVLLSLTLWTFSKKAVE